MTTATVLSSEYHYAKWWEVGEGYEADQSYFVTTFSYVVDDTMYFGSHETWGRCEPGETFEIHFDPRRPAHNSTVEPDKSVGQWLIICSFGVLLAIFLIYLEERFGLPAD